MARQHAGLSLEDQRVGVASRAEIRVQTSNPDDLPNLHSGNAGGIDGSSLDHGAIIGVALRGCTGMSSQQPEEATHPLALMSHQVETGDRLRSSLQGLNSSRVGDRNSGALETLRGFVDTMWKDQESFQKSMSIKEEAVIELEAKLRQSYLELQVAQESECRLQSKVRQGEEEMRHLGRKISLLSEQQNSLMAQLNDGVRDATQAEKERMAIGDDLAKSIRIRQGLEKKLENSQKAASLANNAVIETRKTLEGAKIQLAAQTEENAQLRTRLEETGKEVTEFQKECNHLRLMQRMATESTARLSADAKHQINLLKGQVTAAKNEATAAESQAQKAQQLAEQYLNELQDSAAVLAEEQRKGVVASEDHQSQLAKAQEKYRAQLAHLEQQVESSASKLIQTLTDQRAQVREFEVKITNLESQLVHSGEESKNKLNRLVKETGEQFDKMRNERSREVNALHQQASDAESLKLNFGRKAARQAEILAARAAEVEHLKAENAILAATLRDEAQAAQVAVSAFENTRQKVEGDVHDMRARQNVLVEMNASLQESCEFLKKELQIANEKAVRSEIESTLATERAKSLQDELNTLLLRQPPNHPAEQTVSDGAREYQGQASPSRVENGHSLGLPDLLHKDQAEGDISDDERHVKDGKRATKPEAPAQGPPAKTAKPLKRSLKGLPEHEPSQRLSVDQSAPFLRPRQFKNVPAPKTKSLRARKQDLNFSCKQADPGAGSQQQRVDSYAKPVMSDTPKTAGRSASRMAAKDTLPTKRRQQDKGGSTCGVHNGQRSKKRVEPSPPAACTPKDLTEPIDVLEDEDPVASIFGDFSRNQLLT